MRIKNLLRLLLVAGAALLVWSSTLPAWAQAGSYTKLNPKGREAHSLPISDKTIRFEVTLPSGEVVKLFVQEGGMAKVGNLEEGYAFALVPVVKDKGKQLASFTVFALSQDEAGNELIRQVERLDADSQAPASTKTEPKFQLRVISVEEPKPSLVSRGPTKGFALAVAQRECIGEDCCLRCGNTWACAICVIMDCGCCCDAPYKCQQP